jgi:pimeloyl-ACP methyl ester carboxylesterase
MASGQAAHANDESAAPVKYSRGLIESPPTYYEVLEPPGGSTKPPMMLISGGAHTGACYLATADGRPGWTHAFVRAGYKVVVPDRPGVGRSRYISRDHSTGDVVVEGFGKVVASLGQPAIIMTHSMSGAYGWKLVENYGQHIAKVVAIAPGPRGNIQAVSEIVSETADTGVGPQLGHHGDQPEAAGDFRPTLRRSKAVGRNTQFRCEQIGVYASSLTPIPPRLLYQRRNVHGSQLKVADFSHFRGKRMVGGDRNGGRRSSAQARRSDCRVAQPKRRQGGFHLSGRPWNRRQRPHDDARKNSGALAELVLSWIENG